uniref:Uncharacterized protein n=1 Tax=Schizaphis graminum TaxID=13262 RepID=A0A2S2P7Y7_SCHGA
MMWSLSIFLNSKNQIPNDFVVLKKEKGGDRARRITLYIRGAGRGESDAGPAITASADVEVPAPPSREVIRSKLGTPSARQSGVCAPLPVAPGGPLARGVPRPIDFRSRAGAGRCSRRDRQRWQRRACTVVSQTRGPPPPTPPPPRTFAVPPTEPRARTHTRRYTAATVADPCATQPRSHHVGFFFFFYTATGAGLT